MAIYLETARLILRDWQDSDADTYVQMNLNPAVRRYFPGLQTREESLAAIERFQNGIRTRGYGFFAVALKASDAFIGFTGLSHPGFDAWFTPYPEIGWRLSETAWGQGYATEAAQACLDAAFTRWNMEVVYSFTAAPNLPSERVMQRIGMEKHSTFQHPQLPEGHWLREHVLYRAFSPSRKTISS